MPFLNLSRHLYYFKKMDKKITAEQVKLLQRQRLSHLLKHVMTNSGFYQRYYGEHGITMDKIEDIELKDIPPIDKKVAMENFDDLVCDPVLKKDEIERFISDPSSRGNKFKGSYNVIHTSGTSGTVGIFVYGEKDLDTIMAMDVARFTRTGINPLRKTKAAFFGATDGNYAGVSLLRNAPRFFSKTLLLDIQKPLEETVEALNRFQPDLITSYNSGAYLLAREQLRGSLNIRPKRVNGSADPCTPKIRETVKKAFGIQLFNSYLASESLGMAVECDYHDGLHLFDDWHCFELVDENLNPVGPGEPGTLIITPLYNYTQPLIRYQMQDMLVIDDTPCRCGWPFPRIKKFFGREMETIWFTKTDGVDKTREFISPHSLNEFYVPGLKKHQCIQTGKNRLLLKAVIDADPDETIAAMRRRMAEILAMKNLENEVGFDIELVDEIKNDPKTGKFKLVVPFKE